jgi:hypothetical protein
MASGSA